VQPGGRHDLQAGCLGDDPEAVQVASKAERRPVDERAAACGNERLRLLDCLRDVVELVARLGRGDEEQMLVGIARPELDGLDVAKDRANDLAPSDGGDARSRAGSRRVMRGPAAWHARCRPVGLSSIGFPFASQLSERSLMRKLDCQCGQTIEGENDEELFQRGKQHVAEVHPDENITDDQLRQLISAQAYDA
jgi:predicted small metal-binding protein